MESLADLIKPKTDFKQGDPEHVFSPEWVAAKKKLYQLPNDFRSVFKKVLTDRPHDVYKHVTRRGVNDIRVVLLPINGFEVELGIMEKNGDVLKACYYLFDNRGNNVHIRDVTLV